MMNDHQLTPSLMNAAECARKGLDFSGLSATLFFPLFSALFLFMLIHGLNHLSCLHVYPWFLFYSL